MGHVGKTVTQNVVSGSEITDGTVTGADLASDIAISTSGAITTTGAFTSKGIDDNADAVAMTIDSSENVGIGTTGPVSPLGTNFKVLDINSGVWGGNINFSGNSGGYIGNRHSGNGGLGYYAVSGQGHDFAVNGSTDSVLNIASDGDITGTGSRFKFGAAGSRTVISPGTGVTVTLADDATFSVAGYSGSSSAMLLIYDAGGGGAMFWHTYQSTVTKVAGVGDYVTSEIDGNTCVHKASNNHAVSLTNKEGASVNYYIIAVAAYD